MPDPGVAEVAALVAAQEAIEQSQVTIYSYWQAVPACSQRAGACGRKPTWERWCSWYLPW